MKHRTIFLAGLAAALLAGTALDGAQAAPGDTIRLGQDNDGGAAETIVRADPTGDKATLAILNETTTCPPPCTVYPDTLRAFAGDYGGAAIQAFAGSGTFDRVNFEGIAVRGIGNRIGVWGRSPRTAGTGVRGEATGAGGNGVHAIGPTAVLAQGTAQGVVASGRTAVRGISVCGDPDCAALKGEAPSGLALEAVGRVAFSTAGIAVVPAGADRIGISPGIDVDEDTKVLVTQMSTGGVFKFVVRDFAADSLSFRLAKRTATDVTLAYFVIG
jgi:hypothetical protein